MKPLSLLVTGIVLGVAAVALWLLIFKDAGANHVRTVDAGYSVTNGGDSQSGRTIIELVGCGGCHEISGVPGAHGKIAAPLTGFSDRAMIAGVMANTSENLIRWIMNPREVDSKTAMPNLNLSETEARDVAAYLYSH